MEDVLAGKDTCGLAVFEPYIGQSLDNLDVRDTLPSKYRLRMSDPREWEEGVDQIFTTDLVPRRLNIYLDEGGKLKELDCG